MTVSVKLKVPEGHSLHHVLCPHDCPDSCSMLVTRDDRSGKAVQIQGDPSHPITRGFLCNKVNHYIDYIYSENRILYPHRRIGAKGPGAKFERISWDEALSEISSNFHEIIEKFGSEAIQPINFAGTMGQIGYHVMDERFWNKIEAGRLEKSICVHAAYHANVHTYGPQSGPDIAIASEEAELIILWGFNPVSTSVHSVPFIREAQDRGCSIVAIDPRPTRSTWMADWHLQPKPGTDAALALGMMKVIVDEGLQDQDFLESYTTGWKELINKRLVDYTPEYVSEITGLSVDDIVKLARLYASTKKSNIRAGHGLNRHLNSGQMARAILILPSITGAWRERCGGAGFGRVEEAFGPRVRNDLQRNDLGRRDTKRLINMVQMGRALANNTGEDDQPLDPPVKCLFSYCSDPANSLPNSNNVRKGLMRKDLFTVSHDTFWTDTCDYADIVLPADTQLERTDFVAAYGYFHYAMNLPVIEPLGESVSNSELFRRLAGVMGFVETSGNAFTQTDEEIIRDALLDSDADPALEGCTYAELKSNGWFKGYYDSPKRDVFKTGWPTKDGKVQIYSEDLKNLGQDPLPIYLPEMQALKESKNKEYPFQVLSSASHYLIGSSFHSVERLVAMQSRPTFEIGPVDAKKRKIIDGDLCRLFNGRGETYGHVVVMQGMLSGVIGTQKQMNGSKTVGGVNVNALNTETLTDFGYAPSFYSVSAQIEKASPQMLQDTIVRKCGGRAEYIAEWRDRNSGSDLTDEAILASELERSMEVFNA